MLRSSLGPIVKNLTLLANMMLKYKFCIAKATHISTTKISNLFENILATTVNEFIIVKLTMLWGWSGGVKVLFILHHWGIQLILAYSWSKPAILVAGKGRGGMFLFFLFLHFHSCSSSLSSLLLSLLSLFSLSLGDDTK